MTQKPASKAVCIYRPVRRVCSLKKEAGAEAELCSLTIPIVLPVRVSSGPPIPSSDQQPSEDQPAALWETGSPWPGLW